MGFLDSLLGLNSSANTNAAVAGLPDMTAGNNAILHNQTNNANSALKTGAANATGALTAGYGDALKSLLDYGGQAQGALQTGVDKAVGTVQSSNAGYAPFLSSGQGANTMLANSYGLNGAAGNDAATAAFRASPGYGFQVDQGVDAAARKAASLGMAGSGNTLDAITRLSSNLADQEYGNWRSGLSGLSGQGLTAAAGISGNNSTAGQMQYGGAGALSQILSNLGSGSASLNAAKGTGLANIQTGLGQGLSSNYTGLGNSLVGNNLAGAQMGLQGAEAQDQIQSANNSVLSNLLGSFGKIGAVAALNPSGLKL